MSDIDAAGALHRRVLINSVDVVVPVQQGTSRMFVAIRLRYKSRQRATGYDLATWPRLAVYRFLSGILIGGCTLTP
jgi:hypothetical protein